MNTVMPPNKASTKQMNQTINKLDSPPAYNTRYSRKEQTPAFNTRSSSKSPVYTGTCGPSWRSRRNRSKNRSNGRDDHENFYRLLQLFPYFPPVYLQRVYAECNRDLTRTVDNVLYVKRYCSYLNKIKSETMIMNNVLSPIRDHSSHELHDYDSSDTLQSTSNNSLVTSEIFEETSDDNNSLGLWINSKCETPELDAPPKYTSTPY